ncbi:hypothetical protein QTP88_013219 [Uroleucon formosanum]
MSGYQNEYKQYKQMIRKSDIPRSKLTKNQVTAADHPLPIKTDRETGSSRNAGCSRGRTTVAPTKHVVHKQDTVITVPAKGLGEGGCSVKFDTDGTIAPADKICSVFEQ